MHEGRPIKFGGIGNLISRLAVAVDEPFVGGHLFEGHGAARAELLGGDAYLCAQTELRSVCEAGGGIDIDTSGIDHRLEATSRLLVFGDDAFAVA